MLPVPVHAIDGGLRKAGVVEHGRAFALTTMSVRARASGVGGGFEGGAHGLTLVGSGGYRWVWAGAKYHANNLCLRCNTIDYVVIYSIISVEFEYPRTAGLFCQPATGAQCN